MRFLIASLLFVCGSAMASDFNLFVGIGGGHRDYVYSGGHYETRYETVMVEPERVVREWVQPTYEVRMIDGRPFTVQTRPGYWREAYAPPRYETRAVRVWVPDPVFISTPRPSFGFGFGFGHHDHGCRPAPRHCR